MSSNDTLSVRVSGSRGGLAGVGKRGGGARVSRGVAVSVAISGCVRELYEWAVSMGDACGL